MNAWRIGWQDGAQHGRLRLITHHDTPRLDAITARQDIQIESSRQRIEDVGHVLEHKRVLLHVRQAHVLGQPRGGRLLMRELRWRLLPIADRNSPFGVMVGGLCQAVHQVIG